jgi:hypothetical protein
MTPNEKNVFASTTSARVLRSHTRKSQSEAQLSSSSTLAEETTQVVNAPAEKSAITNPTTPTPVCFKKPAVKNPTSPTFKRPASNNPTTPIRKPVSANSRPIHDTPISQPTDVKLSVAGFASPKNSISSTISNVKNFQRYEDAAFECGFEELINAVYPEVHDSAKDLIKEWDMQLKTEKDVFRMLEQLELELNKKEGIKTLSRIVSHGMHPLKSKFDMLHLQTFQLIIY